jgi:hypothetical protein
VHKQCLTRAQKTLSNPNGFWQSFCARASSSTPDKLGSPLPLRTSPLSLLYNEWSWEHYRKLNLTCLTPSAGSSMGVFIGVLCQWFGRKWGSGGPLVKPVSQLGWPSFMVALALGIIYPMHRPSLTRWQSGIWKGVNTWPTNPTLARLGLSFVPHHPLVSYSLWLCLILDILKIW